MLVVGWCLQSGGVSKLGLQGVRFVITAKHRIAGVLLSNFGHENLAIDHADVVAGLAMERCKMTSISIFDWSLLPTRSSQCYPA